MRSFFWSSALVLFAIAGAVPPAQAQSAPSQSQSSPDPTRREIQPDLRVDRDPVASPDVVVNAPAAPTTTTPGPLEKSNNIYTLHENVDEVLLNCTLVDEKGQTITNLGPQNFRVWEDGVPQTIASFERRDVPVSMGILVDDSGSMRFKRPAVQTAALDLVRESNPRDAEFIVNFNDRAFLDQGFTSNISFLERGLARYDARGTTAIYDAVAASADELAKNASWPKQVLLIITDGDDNASHLNLAQAVEKVQSLGGPVVYAIGLLYDAESPAEAGHAREALETLADDTGGLAFFPSSIDEVDHIAREVALDIRNQYTIGYHSTRPPTQGGYRTVRVEAQAPGHTHLIVRTRHGYYPQQIQQMHTGANESASGTPR